MHEGLRHALRRHRPTLRSLWESLLRAEPVSSPLANPDVLVLMMDWTLDELEAAMRHAPSRRRRPPARAGTPPDGCECRMNPLLIYFRTAEAALDRVLEELPLPVDEGEAAIFTREAFVADARRALRHVSAREIATFCAVCQHRRAPAAVPRAPVSGSLVPIG